MLSIFKTTYICTKLRYLNCGALLFLSIFFIACAHQGDPFSDSREHHSQAHVQHSGNTTDTPSAEKVIIENLELPEIKQGEQIIKHLAFMLSYNEAHEQANWVAYFLKADHLNGKEKRLNDFRPDPAVTTFSADPDDYRGSGYDRGHLVPAGDMKWSKKAMSESFLMSNICPQDHDFNAGIWEKLESDIRKWVKRDSELYIITGPVFTGEMKVIGKNKVSVPAYFFKAVLDFKQPEIKAIAFVIPNKNIKEPYYNYAMPVDSLEKILNLDLFTALPDSIENEIEKTHIWPAWKMLSKP